MSFRTADGVTIAATWYEPSLPAGSSRHSRPHARPLAARLGRPGVAPGRRRVSVRWRSTCAVTVSRPHRRPPPRTADYSAHGAGRRGGAAIPGDAVRRAALADRHRRRVDRREPGGARGRRRRRHRQPGAAVPVARLPRAADRSGGPEVRQPADAAGGRATTTPMRRVRPLDLQKAGGGSAELLSLSAPVMAPTCWAARPSSPQALVDWFRRTLQ